MSSFNTRGWYSASIEAERCSLCELAMCAYQSVACRRKRGEKTPKEIVLETVMESGPLTLSAIAYETELDFDRVSRIVRRARMNGELVVRNGGYMVA